MNFNYNLFRVLASLTQEKTYSFVKNYLTKRYDSKSFIETKDYLIVTGDIPVALVAHLDTVFEAPPTNIYFDVINNVCWSPEGLGADDRAGVYAIIQIVEKGLRPSIILTTNEEIGALGARALGQIECPIKDLKYVIELDRQGKDDCVFYDCGNEDFYDYIKNFGFNFNIGTYSDIKFFCPQWDVAAVNLSIGYFEEHSYAEYLNVDYLLDTIQKVINILNSENKPHFSYMKIKPLRCSKCGDIHEDVFNWTIGTYCLKCAMEEYDSTN